MDTYILKISFVVEMAVILYIFCTSMQKKRYFWTKAILGISILLILNGFWNSEWPMLGLFFHYFAIILLFYLLLEICYDERTNKKLFCLTAAYSVQTILYCSYTILEYLFHCLLSVSLAEKISYIFYFVIYFVGYMACFLFFAERVNKNVNLDNKIVITLAGCIILVSNLFNILILQARIPEYAYQLLYKPMSNILCILLLCLQFNLVSNQSLIIERNLLEHLLSEKDKQYQISKNNIELIQIKCHDLKYQLEALRHNSNNINNEVINEIKDKIDIYDSMINTGNEALDVILTEKSLICKKLKINITVMIDGSKLNFMNVIDLYCMFGNVIDNAIEALKKETNIEKRLIDITSRLNGNIFSINIVNYCSEKLKWEEGLPISSKNDKNNHGFGLKSVKYIIGQYDGDMIVYKKDDLFVLNLLLPLK